MNFLKSLFSPHKKEKGQNIDHIQTCQSPTCNKDQYGETSHSTRKTSAFSNIFDAEDGTEARYCSNCSSSTEEAKSIIEPATPPVFHFQDIDNAFITIKAATEWEKWCIDLFRSATDNLDKVRFSNVISQKLHRANRQDECFAFVRECVNIFISESKNFLLEEYIKIFNTSTFGKKRNSTSNKETPKHILEILLLEAYYLQLCIRKLKIDSSARHLNSKVHKSFDFYNPSISSEDENNNLETFLSVRLAFSANYATSWELQTTGSTIKIADTQQLVQKVHLFFLTNVFTLIQKLSYPVHGEVVKFLVSICCTEDKDFHRGSVSLWGGDVEVIRMLPSLPSSLISKAEKLSPEHSPHVISSVFSTGLMYLNSYQRFRTSYQKNLHKEIHSYFDEVELSFDTSENLQYRQHSTFAISFDERLSQLCLRMENTQAIAVDWSNLVDSIQLGLAIFKWLLWAHENGAFSTKDMLCTKSVTFIFQVAEFLHFDGMDAEAFFLYSFLAHFCEDGSVDNLSAEEKIFESKARHNFQLEERNLLGKEKTTERRTHSNFHSFVPYMLDKHQIGDIDHGALANILKSFLSKFIPFLRNAEALRSHLISDRVAIISSTSEAHDISEACCKLSLIFLAREDPDSAIRFFLAVMRIIVSSNALSNIRFFALVCVGIGRATMNTDVKRSIFLSIDSILLNRIQIRQQFKFNWRDLFRISAPEAYTCLALELELEDANICMRLFSGVKPNLWNKILLVPRESEVCYTAMKVADYIRKQKTDAAMSILSNRCLCPFTPVLITKCLKNEIFFLARKNILLQCVLSHKCIGLCSALDQKHLIHTASDLYMVSHNVQLAKLVIENTGNSFNSLSEKPLETLADTSVPSTVSLCCISCDPMLTALWIARVDFFKGAEQPRHLIVRIPMTSEIVLLVDSLHRLLRRASNDISSDKKDNDTYQRSFHSRKSFWNQRKHFDTEIKFLIARMERILGYWKCFLLGMPFLNYDHVRQLIQPFNRQIVKIFSSFDTPNFSAITEYVLLIWLSYTCNKEIFEHYEPKSEYLVNILQVLAGVQYLSANVKDALLLCIEQMKLKWDYTIIQSNECNKNSIHAPKSSPLNRGKVWLLIDHPFFAKFPWEMMPMYQKSKSIVVRIPSLLYALSADSLLKARKDKALFKENSRFISTPALFYCLNPSGDIESSQQKFFDLFQSIPNWNGVVGSYDCKKCVQGFQSNDVYLYIGHGSGEKSTPKSLLLDYTGPKQKPEHHQTIITLLMGCSSCAMQKCPLNPPNIFLTAGSIFFVGTLWDVTDGEIDRFTTSLLLDALISPDHCSSNFDKFKKNVIEDITTSASMSEIFPKQADSMSSEMKQLHEAISSARYACKLPFLTGAGVIMYGI